SKIHNVSHPNLRVGAQMTPLYKRKYIIHQSVMTVKGFSPEHNIHIDTRFMYEGTDFLYIQF
ncbi:hypothetical protein ACJX0J_007577, partial [Zea mays]